MTLRDLINVLSENNILDKNVIDIIDTLREAVLQEVRSYSVLVNISCSIWLQHIMYIIINSNIN